MHSIARKVAVSASPDGIVLQPLGRRGERPAPAVRIAFTDASIGPHLSKDGDGGASEKGFECHGVVGMFCLTG